MRVLMLAHPGTNSRDILMDAEAGFRHAGHEVIRWEFEPMQRVVGMVSDPAGKASLSAGLGGIVKSLCETNGIDFTIGMWANGLMAFGVAPPQGGTVPMSFFERSKIRHVLFWLDAPHWAHGGGVAPLFRSPVVAEPRLFHVINNEGLAGEMRQVLGFGRVLGRRYGVNPEVFKPWPGVSAKHDIVFNLGPGDPGPSELMVRELESDDPDVDAIRREAGDEARRRMGAALAETGDLGVGAAGEALLDRWIAAQLASPGVPLMDRLSAIAAESDDLRRAVDAVRTKPRVFVQIAEHARCVERWRRAFTISYLSRHADCAVFGQDGLADWPHRAKQYGGVPYRELSKIYGMGRLALNVMRWQDDVGLNIKPLEITASGTACLCERRTGLDEMFELGGDGAEAAAFDTPGGARRVAAELLASPERLGTMAEAGRARTLRDHTWARWADDVCAFVDGAA